MAGVPWVPEVFLACCGNFRCWPKADTSSVVGRSHERRRRAGHYKDLTETGNRARKVSGTQGRQVWRFRENLHDDREPQASVLKGQSYIR